ncbi:hypothetical protein BC834DRAFT_969468 [Gloeopeniophorella convolvens]|nr:hypothetical protein BC834DRAFT_969468 [Gloeopeniophorella convolvens]
MTRVQCSQLTKKLDPCVLPTPAPPIPSSTPRPRTAEQVDAAIKCPNLTGGSHSPSPTPSSTATSPAMLPLLDLAIARAVRAHDDRLRALFRAHRTTVRELQHTLLTQILPSVANELGLDPTARDWAEEWLHDDLSIFHMLKRHKFTKAFALDALCSVLTWHLAHLKTQDVRAFPCALLHLVPAPAADAHGRPVLVLRLARLVRGGARGCDASTSR